VRLALPLGLVLEMLTMGLIGGRLELALVKPAVGLFAARLGLVLVVKG